MIDRYVNKHIFIYRDGQRKREREREVETERDIKDPKEREIKILLIFSKCII